MYDIDSIFLSKNPRIVFPSNDTPGQTICLSWLVTCGKWCWRCVFTQLGHYTICGDRNNDCLQLQYQFGYWWPSWNLAKGGQIFHLCNSKQFPLVDFLYSFWNLTMHGQISTFEIATDFYLFQNHYPVLQTPKGSEIDQVKQMHCDKQCACTTIFHENGIYWTCFVLYQLHIAWHCVITFPPFGHFVSLFRCK